MFRADHLHGAGYLAIAEAPLRVGIVAGELSGDALGASLVSGLAAATGQPPELTGVGGPALAAQGLRPILPFDTFDIHGFLEPLRRLPAMIRALYRIERAVLDARVDVFVGVDFNVFNLLLERRLKRRGVPTVHYVSPSVYAWRRGRVRRIARSADLLLALFPFEPDFYADQPIDVAYVGHPLADALPAAQRVTRRAEARAQLGVGAEDKVLAVLPGSRRSEVARLLPTFLAAAAQYAAAQPLQILIPAPRPALAALIRQQAADHPLAASVRVLDEAATRTLAAADLALVKAGTGTLEATLHGVPMVVGYRLDRLTYAIAKRLVRTPHIALPNLLAGETLVPEFVQDALRPEPLAAALAQVERERAGLEARFRAIHDQLSCNNAQAAAAAVLRRIGR